MTDEFVPSLTYDLVYREGIVAARLLVIGAESPRRFVIRDELKPFVEQTRAAGVAEPPKRGKAGGANEGAGISRCELSELLCDRVRPPVTFDARLPPVKIVNGLGKGNVGARVRERWNGRGLGMFAAKYREFANKINDSKRVLLREHDNRIVGSGICSEASREPSCKVR